MVAIWIRAYRLRVRRRVRFKPSCYERFDREGSPHFDAEIILAGATAIHLELQDVTTAVSAIETALFQTSNPFLIARIALWSLVESHVPATHSRPEVPEVGKARKVGLAKSARVCGARIRLGAKTRTQLMRLGRLVRLL